MGIFTDGQGNSIKFFIQKDLPDDLQNTLRDAVQAEDGIVDTKVPIKGYILIQPKSTEAERLRACWTSPDRPERFFVPYTWVDASREAGKMIPQIFVKNGDPIKMRIHNSIANLNSRETIASRIVHAGGDPDGSEEEATVILADPETEIYAEIVKHYQNKPNRAVESHLWVKKCIDRGILFHSGHFYKNPGGRRPGDERTAFTEDDEANLCTWIAAVIPYKESGGRTGNKIYQELVARAHDPGYEWVARHTWQSWRERYKKNAVRLDSHIAAIVNLGQAGPIGKAQFGYFRLSEGKQKPVRKRRRRAGETDQSEEDGAHYSGALPAGTSVTAGVTASRSDESEWAIKEGHDPAPEWAAKRDGTGDSPSKRQKVVGGVVPPYGQQQVLQPQPLHPIDQAILDIASEFQFLPSEVREFYDKTGDVDATRNRFAKMRMMINSMG